MKKSKEAGGRADTKKERTQALGLGGRKRKGGAIGSREMEKLKEGNRETQEREGRRHAEKKVHDVRGKAGIKKFNRKGEKEQ